MAITAQVTVLRDGIEATDLSPAERILASYALAEAVAATLAEGGNLSAGHKAALYSNFVSLMMRDKKDARLFLNILAGMLGCNAYAHGIPDEIEDVTDWTEVALT